MTDRIYFDEIDSSGTFRSGDVRLDIIFTDSEGNEHTWYPEWEDVRNLYAEAERVEEMNPTGDHDLDELKKLKQLDDPIIREIADIIADTWHGDDLGRFFRELGYDTDYGFQVEENARTFPAETGGAENVRINFVHRQIQELNEEDYQLVVEVIEKATSPKEHIDKEDRLEAVRYRFNKALQHEGWKVTRDGIVRPLEYDESS